jgi:superfamily II DNA/RNA helicase
VNLSQVEIFVLDEADRMLDMGFIPDIKRIMALLPGHGQTPEPALFGDFLERDQEARRPTAQRPDAD